MIVVADSSPLVALATCSALDVLADLYSDVRVPNAVFKEVTRRGKPFSSELREFCLVE